MSEQSLSIYNHGWRLWCVFTPDPSSTSMSIWFREFSLALIAKASQQLIKQKNLRFHVDAITLKSASVVSCRLLHCCIKAKKETFKMHFFC